MEPIKKADALTEFFSTPEKPVTSSELLSFRKHDVAGFDELAALAAKALGRELIQREGQARG